MRKSPTTVRPARQEDAEALAGIYNQGIEDGVATFETEPRTAASVAELLAARMDTHPALVGERDGQVLAFAWTAPYSSRPCYAGVAEFSVYVRRDARGTGLGRLVVGALIEASEAHGFWKLESGIFPENSASRGLCTALGFREVGTWRRHARLDGTWRDVVIVERLLGEAAAAD